MRTMILLTAAVGLCLLASVSGAAESEREAYTEIREQLANEEFDAAEEGLAQALKEYPDSRQLKSLHAMFYSYLSRASRHADAAEHAAANAEIWLENLPQSPAQAAHFGTIVRQMTSAYGAAGQEDVGLEKLEQIVQKVESIEAETDAPEVEGLLVELQAHRAARLAEQGKADEAKELLTRLQTRTEQAMNENPDDAGKVLALANVLAAWSGIANTPEEQEAARREHREFLAKQAKDHVDSVPVVSAYISSELSSISQLARSDAKQADERLTEFQSFLDSIESEDEPAQRLVSRTERSVASLKRRIESALVQQALIGQPAFPLDAEAWVNGDPLTDEDLQGKVVLLDFWAVWCGPCIATFPHLREWREKYGNEGLVIIGATRHYGYDWDDEAESIKRAPDLSPEDEQAAMIRFAEHHELKHPFMVMPQGSDFSKKYGVTGIPTAVLIDREGLVRMIRVGSGEENAQALEGLIEELVHGTSNSAGG